MKPRLEVANLLDCGEKHVDILIFVYDVCKNLYKDVSNVSLFVR